MGCPGTSEAEDVRGNHRVDEEFEFEPLDGADERALSVLMDVLHGLDPRRLQIADQGSSTVTMTTESKKERSKDGCERLGGKSRSREQSAAE